VYSSDPEEAMPRWLAQTFWPQFQGRPCPDVRAPMVYLLSPEGLVVPMPPPDCCCTHAKQTQGCPRVPAEAEMARLKSDVLENLEKLEKAHKLCRKAQRRCEAGQLEEAKQIYEKVLRLCPGSRYEPVVISGLRYIEACMAAEAAAAEEEQEMLPPPKQAKKKCCEPAGVWVMPAPPPVDPRTAEALDDILVFVEPNRPKLYLRVEQASGGEEQDEPPCDTLCNMLRRVMAVLGAVGCTDEGGANKAVPHVECEMQFGNFVIRMTVDKKCPNCCCPKKDACPKEDPVK
jgi:hypothetical protein